MTSAGEVVVERTLYKDRTDQDGRCVSPMELTLGIIGDFWTPRAAQQALWVVTQMTPRKSAELFERVGSMKPSKSSLGRLPKVVAERWEADRETFEATLRDGLQIPEGTVSIAVSLDGVLAPIDGANRPTDVRAKAAAEGWVSKGPRRLPRGELRDGVVLRRQGGPARRRPNGTRAGDAEETAAILRRRPDLKLVKVADGAADNWDFLSSAALPAGEEAVDFFHASEHLHAAIDRFDEAWALIAATFHADVTVLANVIALKPQTTPKNGAHAASR